MRFFSFVRDGFILTPVEVQIHLMRGIPEVKFSGLPDVAIKESITRLKSAFKKSGFSWPSKQQIIINLSPAYIKKTSLGLDLALATALLYKTNQIRFFSSAYEKMYAYGEIGLHGDISVPEDIEALPFLDAPLLTGILNKKNYRDFIYISKNLKELPHIKKAPVSPWEEELERPQTPKIFFSPKATQILKLSAVGEHNLLLCGESGSGKTTLADHLFYLLSRPKKETWSEIKKMWKDSSIKWRPSLKPHHTTTPLSLIGGGCPLFPGEISKSHGGQLIMDEYLEFHPKVQEALREPVEKGEIRLVRRGISAVFPARFLLTATTNLCPCGDYTPNKMVSCSYSLKKCQSHLERLSGPMLDRFDLLAFSQEWKGDKEISLKDIKEDVEKAVAFRLRERNQKIPNSRLELQELEEVTDPSVLRVLPETSSLRRKRALLRVSRTLADIREDKRVNELHIEEVFALSIKNFYFLRNRMMT